MGTKTENVVMSTYHVLMVLLTVILIHRWIQRHRNRKARV